MEIMGSTLARPGTISKPFFNQSMGTNILQRLEKTSWIGCPAYLLEVIFFLHAQNYSDEGELHSLSFLRSALNRPGSSLSRLMASKEKAEIILRHIYAFSPSRWAEDMQSTLFLRDLSKRIALASAYKSAVYLYAQRIFSVPSCHMGKVGITNEELQEGTHENGSPSMFSNSQLLGSCTLPPYSRRQAATDLIRHISVIPYSDHHFKCTIWLTFIAGAEATTAQQRQFTLERLEMLWDAIASVNVQNAAQVLKSMWHKRREWRKARMGQHKDHEVEYADSTHEMVHENSADESSPTINDGLEVHDDVDDVDDEFNWIQVLDRSRTDWLFI